LRRWDLLRKDDIQRYALVDKLCSSGYFAEDRFRFLVGWDPSLLVQTNRFGGQPSLHLVAIDSSIQGFQVVFDSCICYYPKKKGISLLFTKNRGGSTPFQIAHGNFGHDTVMEVVEDILPRYSDTTPINIEEALLSAAIDENIHLDCVYFLLRRHPDTIKGLPSTPKKKKRKKNKNMIVLPPLPSTPRRKKKKKKNNKWKNKKNKTTMMIVMMMMIV
jgi:hypothetical protein